MPILINNRDVSNRKLVNSNNGSIFYPVQFFTQNKALESLFHWSGTWEITVNGPVKIH